MIIFHKTKPLIIIYHVMEFLHPFFWFLPVCCSLFQSTDQFNRVLANPLSRQTPAIDGQLERIWLSVLHWKTLEQHTKFEH